MGKKFLSVFTVLFALIFLPLPLFAEINLLSPVEGQFANRQMLVIDNSEGGDFFYSIDGANPETFGFAYDGPVLLDVTGEINLNVTRIAAGGKKENISLNFTVNPDDASKTDYKGFIQTFFDGGLLNYSAGSELTIPSDFVFYLGLPPENDMPESFMPARTLKLSAASVLSRYIPCTILDKKRDLRYRFIIKTYPQSAGIYSHRDVPFSITDWDTINFDDDNYIYKIDSEYWGLPKEARKIDRSSSHMISWQPLEYEAGNPIEFFVLPPKPEIVREQQPDGSILCSIRGDDSYSLGILEEDGSCSELFSQVGIDAFYGDQVAGSLSLGIFSNSVYQGKFALSYNVNRRPPQIPLIKTNAEGFVSRGNVDVKIQGTRGVDLYIALSEPLTLDVSDFSYSSDDEKFKKVSLGEYKKVKGDSFTLHWAQNGLNPVYYKVSAYCKSDENQSLAAEFSVVIDQSNYYFNAEAGKTSASDTSPDGTAAHPFTDFSQLAPALVKQRVVKLNVKGEMQINEAYPVQANFEIINDGDARICFGPKGSLVVKASTVEISNCRIHNTAALNAKSIVPLFKLENSVLTMNDCMIGAEFTRNGTVIDATNGIVNISNTIASANAVTYVSFISSVKSRITIKGSSISANAETGVIISADGGNVTAQKNEFLVTGGNGRIAELFGVNAVFKENSFKARLSNTTSKIQPVYVNKATKLTDENNSIQGF